MLRRVESLQSPSPGRKERCHLTDRVNLVVPRNQTMLGILGMNDEHLRAVESAFPEVAITARGNEIAIVGVEATSVAKLFEELIMLVESGEHIEKYNLARTIDMIKANEIPSDIVNLELLRSAKGKAVKPKTAGQRRYVEAIAKNVVTFGIGPAGTGKSYLAVALAIQALQQKAVNRIILTRPAVEAGERLGFLPGDLMAKVDPYLRPLYDALYDIIEPEVTQRLLERGTIEVAPLAFMRGRTLNSSFIILDEAQNTTPEQMKMFLTRIGFGSKVVVTGDTTQIDVPNGRSGLVGIESTLSNVDDLAFIHLGSRDVVRHPIVSRIVNAYDRVEFQGREDSKE